MLAVTIGLSVRRETLSALGSHWPAVVSVTITTLFLSARAGLRLSRQRDVGAVTGVLAMIAGGATGLVAVAHDLGADERLVVITQHLRVVLTRCPPGRVSLSCRLVLSIVDPWATSGPLSDGWATTESFRHVTRCEFRQLINSFRPGYRSVASP